MYKVTYRVTPSILSAFLVETEDPDQIRQAWPDKDIVGITAISIQEATSLIMRGMSARKI
jgi:hypothetical protein